MTRKKKLTEEQLEEKQGNIDSEPLTYNNIARSDPPKEVEIPSEDPQHKSVSDAIDSVQDFSDIQAIVNKLFPIGLGDGAIRGRIMDAIMVARVHPEAYLSLIRLGVRSDMIRSDYRKPFDVYASLIKHVTLLSIALDGKGRIDLAECAGAARESRKENLGGLTGG